MPLSVEGIDGTGARRMSVINESGAGERVQGFVVREGWEEISDTGVPTRVRVCGGELRIRGGEPLGSSGVGGLGGATTFGGHARAAAPVAQRLAANEDRRDPRKEALIQTDV